MDDPGVDIESSTSLPPGNAFPDNELSLNGTITSAEDLNSDSPKNSPTSGSPITDDKPSIPQNPEDLARLKRQ